MGGFYTGRGKRMSKQEVIKEDIMNVTTDNGEGVTIYYNPIIKIEWIMSED